MDDSGANESEAKDRLRNAVLHDPGQADTSWALLIAACACLAAARSGTDRPGLQRLFLNAGIDLQAPRSYRDDIARLRAHSQTTVDRIAHLARIQIGATEVKIQRHSTEELRRAAEEDARLVVGVPGAGKSGALHDLVQELKDEGRDVVLLAVDQLVARSLGEIRQELGIDHDLTEILANWPGATPAFLVIDALDAARAEPAVRMIRDRIRVIVGQQGRWHVVASIRKFDLRYSQELKQLFVGGPPTTLEEFVDPESNSIRHLNVPQLSDEELARIGHQSPELQQLIDGAPQELRELLRIPFNQADILLVGDGKARDLAIQRGLRVMGTVGVLERAAARGLVALPEVLTRLLSTNFRILRTIINDALARDATRKRQEVENQDHSYPRRTDSMPYVLILQCAPRQRPCLALGLHVRCHLLGRRRIMEKSIKPANALGECARELRHYRPQGSCQQALGRRSMHHRGASDARNEWLLDTSSIPLQGAPCKPRCVGSDGNASRLTADLGIVDDTQDHFERRLWRQRTLRKQLVRQPLLLGRPFSGPQSGMLS